MQKTTLDEYFDLLTTTHSTNLVREFLHKHHEVLLQNPLRYAVFAHRKDIVALLLELNVDVNATDLHGRTALHYALSNRRTKIVELLLAQKALHNADSQDNTPLHLALMDPEYLFVPTLLENYSAELDLTLIVKIIRNSDMPAKIRHAAYLHLVAKAPVELLREFAKDMDFNYVDSKGNGAVLVACQTGNIDALIWLCKTKAQPLTLEVRNTAGECPVLTATVHGQRDLLMDFLVRPVAFGGCGLNIYAASTVTHHDTVHTAIANGQVTLLKEFEHVIKFSIKQYDNYFNRPVGLAIKGGHKEMLALLVKPVRKGGYGLSIDSVQQNLQQGSNAIECAIFFKQKELLRELVRPKSQGGFGCSFNVKKVLAFAIDKPEMLLELIRPVEQGGHGLDFKVCEKYFEYHHGNRGYIAYLKFAAITTLVNAGAREMLTDYIAAVYPEKQSMQLPSHLSNAAIAQGHVEILDDLVRPIAQDGFGLTLDSDAIVTAIFHNRCQILLMLIRPVKDGGFGMTVDIQTVMDRIYCYNDIPLEALFLFTIDHFNKLNFENGIDTAISWAQGLQLYTAESVKGYADFPSKVFREKRSIEFKKVLANHYKELISVCFQKENIEDARKIATALENISKGEGLFFMAEIFNREGNYLDAFQYYLQVYAIKDSPLHERSGCVLASLILSGKFVLQSSPHWELDLDIMQDRAIKAYQYLHGGVAESSVELRIFLDQILAGNLCNPYDIGKAVTWQHEALIKFNDYYSETAPTLLNEPACRRSQAHANLVLRELMSPSKYTPRFAMPTDQKETPNNNNNPSASKGF